MKYLIFRMVYHSIYIFKSVTCYISICPIPIQIMRTKCPKFQYGNGSLSKNTLFSYLQNFSPLFKTFFNYCEWKIIDTVKESPMLPTQKTLFLGRRSIKFVFLVSYWLSRYNIHSSGRQYKATCNYLTNLIETGKIISNKTSPEFYSIKHISITYGLERIAFFMA